MTTLTISLPDSLREFVDRQVRTKGYGNTSEYFRGLLRDAQNREADERIDTLLLESLQDTRPDIEITPEYWEKKREAIMKRVAQKKTKQSR